MELRTYPSVMTGRIADIVTVPDVVGLPFPVGRDLAVEAGVSLANPDPDGPPIGALAWPGLFYITSQHPEPGTEVHRWDSVAVEISAHGTAGSGTLASAPGPLPPDAAAARAENESFVDLSDVDGQ